MATGKTPAGKLSPHEVEKVWAYKEVIEEMEKHLGKTCWELVGKGKKEFTAQKLSEKGGHSVTGRAVQKHWTKAAQKKKDSEKASSTAGRPPTISFKQKQAIAQKAMELKKALIAPTPERIRMCLPKTTINKAANKSISDWTFHQVFKTMCYDEKEDDPWQYLPSLEQDCLSADMKPGRVKTATHVLNNFTDDASWNFVAIDPCLTLLPTKQEKADLLKIAAMGHYKWMSKKSRRKGANLRAPDTAKTQKRDCNVVPWTPVFTRGHLKLVVFTEPDARLNKSQGVADFVKNELPAVLSSMKDEWGWATIPRVILHDKASYFVDNGRNSVNTTFARGLKAGRFRSWVEDDTSWLAPKLGDFYPHETIISHVRRLLSTKFCKCSLWETPQQFAARMAKMEKHMNEEMGDALERLGKEALLKRAAASKKARGERLPK